MKTIITGQEQRETTEADIAIQIRLVHSLEVDFSETSKLKLNDIQFFKFIFTHFFPIFVFFILFYSLSRLMKAK